MKLPANPLVHEIFTWVWLHDLSVVAGDCVVMDNQLVHCSYPNLTVGSPQTFQVTLRTEL